MATGIFRGIARILNLTRIVVLNIVFFFFFSIFLIAVFTASKPGIPSEAALVIAPQGTLVEELSGDPVDRAVNKFMGQEEPETLVHDVIKAIEAGASDSRIKALVLDLDGLTGGGLSKLQEVAAAVQEFKKSGKPVIALGDGYTQVQYFLASPADEIHMHPLGFVFIDGYGRYRLYFKEALDKLAIEWNVFRVGEYKSFVEPYTRNNMSPEDREASLGYLGALWDAYRRDVASTRALADDALDRYIEEILPRLEARQGNMAELALDAGLVDKLSSRTEMRERIIEITGEDEDTHSFKQIDGTTYLTLVRAERALAPESDNKIAVVIASGTIVDGVQPPGTIGGDSTAALIRKARTDDEVKAIVLRVDSGGGSAFASQVILEEILQAKRAGKPVVASMSSVAASGGYWISMATDEIWAYPATVTGSIGILGMFPTFEKTLSKIGVYSDGVGTTWLSGALNPAESMQPDVKKLFELAINHGYQEFIAKVAEFRGMGVEEVDKIARGRVWSGRDAHELGLVDRLGGLDEAVGSAAALAGVEDDYAVKFVQRELSFKDKLLVDMFSGVIRMLAPVARTSQLPFSSIFNRAAAELKELSRFNDPAGLYYYCLCGVD